MLIDLNYFSFSDCNAQNQLTSSTGKFTFCSGENVILTCNMASSNHFWTISTITGPIIILSTGSLNNNLPNGIKFRVTSLTSDTVITSIMTFTASEIVIANGSDVSCSSNSIPLWKTIEIFGE